MTGAEIELLAAINRARSSHNRKMLDFNPALETSARAWAEHLAAIGQLLHGDFVSRIDSAYPGNRGAAENIAEGQPDVDSVVESWMSDWDHRHNLLGEYDVFGASVARSADGTPYWVVDLALEPCL